MSELVQGKPASLDKLSETVDRAALRKVCSAVTVRLLLKSGQIFKTGNDELPDGLLTTYTALNKTIGVF